MIFVSQHSQFECLKYKVYRNVGGGGGELGTTIVSFAFSMWAVEELMKNTGMLHNGTLLCKQEMVLIGLPVTQFSKLYHPIPTG